jgi:uncharacterized protein (TIGR02646 family)
MRPILKGWWPIRGNQVRYVFNDWTRAIPYLKSRTGKYCHLCEMKVDPISIEHILPKSHFEDLASDWDNFLLICHYCNSHKSNEIPVLPYANNYYWPHLNNTLMAFFYPKNGEVIPNKEHLTVSHQVEKAENTIKLYGLNKKVTQQGNSDERLKNRLIAYKQAIDRFIEKSDGKATVRAIVDNAQNTGFFSVWLQVFNNCPDVKEALIQSPAFHLTAGNFFDENLRPIRRNRHDV